MAYSKQTWKDNDPSTPLSAARLSHIEDGIANIELTPGPAGPAGQDAVITPANAVADATGAEDVVTRFNELLASLRAAGFLKQ